MHAVVGDTANLPVIKQADPPILTAFLRPAILGFAAGRSVSTGKQTATPLSHWDNHAPTRGFNDAGNVAVK